MIASRAISRRPLVPPQCLSYHDPAAQAEKRRYSSLVHHFIERKSMELKLSGETCAAAGAIDRLMAYDWPGNVRELENMIERALIQTGGVCFHLRRFWPHRFPES